jgi:hypothetical protein
MRTASSRPALTASWLRRAVPAPLPWAVRTAGRWCLLAGVAGFPCDVLLSAHSPIHDITLGAALLAGGLVALAYPVWLTVLSYRLPGHLADRAGSR